VIVTFAISLLLHIVVLMLKSCYYPTSEVRGGSDPNPLVRTLCRATSGSCIRITQLFSVIVMSSVSIFFMKMLRHYVLNLRPLTTV
jgi:hypothetical protein